MRHEHKFITINNKTYFRENDNNDEFLLIVVVKI